ncbi:MAG: hypothetical protein ACRD9R_13020, partial [Pyrinomonadaceae bacterium]
MKLKIFMAVVLVALAWFAGRHFSRGETLIGSQHTQEQQQAQQSSAPGERVINNSFRLEPDARVEVSGINGPVEVLTADGQTAEVHVELTGGEHADLDSRRVVVQQTAAGLSVRGEKKRDWSFWNWIIGGGEVKQNVTLRVPRDVALQVRGVNGRVSIGELDGPVKVSGVNGKVEIGRAIGALEVSGVNGGVSVGVSELGQEGMRVSGVNGSVELRFGPDVNADLKVSGLNGGFSVDA